MRRLSRVGSLALLAAVLGAAPAHAVDRGGFFGGGGVGAGWIQSGNFDNLAGLSAGFHAGWMFGERWGLVADGAAVLHPLTASSPQVTSGIGGIGARFFAGERVWIQVVIGSGGLDTLLSSLSVERNNSAAVMGALGVEVLQGDSFVLDLSARAGTFEDENGSVTNLSLQVRVNWY